MVCSRVRIGTEVSKRVATWCVNAIRVLRSTELRTEFPVPRRGVVVMRELQKRRHAIQLPLAAKHAEEVVRGGDAIAVGGAMARNAALIRSLESIAKGVAQDVSCLQVDGAAEEAGERVPVLAAVGLELRDIGLELVRRVAEPHGFDVSRDDKTELGGFFIFLARDAAATATNWCLYC